ncbi:MAG: FKBP-type peptidyl-prolyl cis-trans isomerase [Cytophagales bacterium]|nr:FKBP-type peptidyl-prolyl cis-trans isomerase [Cytophagales bacterium]
MTIETTVITEHSFLTLHYRLSSTDGTDIINTFNDKPATITLGTGQLSPALEAHLLGLAEGSHETFAVPASSAAFGERNPDMVQWVARSLLKKLGDKDESYAVGDVVQFPTPDGQATYAGAVQAANDESVQFDFNHPLAGQAVLFEAKILGIL